MAFEPFTEDEEGKVPDTLCGMPLALQPPDTLMERWDPVLAHATASEAAKHRIYLGALGLANPRIRRRLPYTGDVMAYGAKVLEMLTGTQEPDSIFTIMRVARAAYRCLEASTIKPEMIEAARGKSEPPGSTETSPSPTKS